ncbi:MAG: DUF3037 domain-containing protein [Hoeflea sp.]|nr:DUF3037 domain-containing protein [Hoeflea sp.]
MDKNQGYFAIVQYAEFPERSEFVNIGVVLFIDQAPYVLSKFGARVRRVQAAFNVHLGRHFVLQQESMKNRLTTEFGHGWRKEQIENFISLRSGKIRFSPLRSVLVDEPLIVIEQLFCDLVGDILHPRKRRQRASSRLAETFKFKGVDELLYRPSPIELSGGVTISAQFAYQNGALNLIEAVSLSGAPEKALNRVSPHLIEGKLLSETNALLEPKRLVVVADNTDEHDRQFMDMLERQMKSHDVRFFKMDEIDSLVQDIRFNYSKHH